MTTNLLETLEREGDVDSGKLQQAIFSYRLSQITCVALLEFANLLAGLLDLGGRRDSRNELLQTLLECRSVVDIEEDEVLIALRKTKALQSSQ